MYWKIPKIWQDSRCIILGGGPSLASQFDVPAKLVSDIRANVKPISDMSEYMGSIQNEHIIAVNQSFRFGNWVDCLFFGDHGFWEKNKEDILNFNGIKTTSVEIPNIFRRRVKVIPRYPNKKVGISPSPNAIVWNRNSGAAAISLAVHFGVKQIILLGFDMNLDAGHQHWHGLYGKNKNPIGTFKMHLRAFPAIAEDAKKFGVEILNASPMSRIGDFRKGTLKEFL